MKQIEMVSRVMQLRKCLLNPHEVWGTHNTQGDIITPDSRIDERQAKARWIATSSSPQKPLRSDTRFRGGKGL